MKFLTKNFRRILILGSPIAMVVLMVPSADMRSSYDESFGWPLVYGSRALDVLPKRFPTIENIAALGIDVAIGLTVYVLACALGRAWYLKTKRRNTRSSDSGKAQEDGCG